MITIRIAGLDELLRLARTDFGPTLRAILLSVGKLVEGEMARAPGPVHKPIRWASEKQRRFVMAQVRRYGPWVRESHSLSQRMLASWTVRAESDTRVVVGNKATYGPWVQGADYQQPMHKATGWVTDEAALSAVARSGDVEQIAAQAIEHFLGSR
jgi:hypothetical protein